MVSQSHQTQHFDSHNPKIMAIVTADPTPAHGVVSMPKDPDNVNVDQEHNSGQKEIAVDTVQNSAVNPCRNRYVPWNPGHANRNGFRPKFDRAAENAELKRQKAKAQEILAAEKKAKSETRKLVEDAMHILQMDNLRIRMDLIELESRLKEKEIELQKREAWCKSTEVYLSVGQKILESVLSRGEDAHSNLTDAEKEKSRDTGMEKLRVADKEKLRDELASEYGARYRHVNSSLDSKAEELKIWEEHIKVREETWKAIASDELRKELQNELVLEREAELCDEHYNKGFEDGKEVGIREHMPQVRQEGFTEGYALAHRRFAAMKQLQNGELHHSDPHLQSILDPSHPENPFNIGMAAGKQSVNSSRPFPTAQVNRSRHIKHPQPPKAPLSDSASNAENKPQVRPLIDPGSPTWYEKFHGPHKRQDGDVIYANCDANARTNGTANGDDQDKGSSPSDDDMINLID